MKKILFILFSIIATLSESQNLVPNGSFETINSCTNSFQTTSNAIGWKEMETPDCYNSCVIPINAYNTDVPQNMLGYQIPEEGNGYAGIGCYYYGNFREMIETALSQPLTAGKHYCINFYINLADTVRYAIDKIGAYVSVDTIIPPYSSSSSTFNYYIPQVESNSIITDTANWTNISGSFVALGNEDHITFGNFRDDAGTDTLRVRNGFTAFPDAYYYIDNISLEEVLDAKAGNDTSFYLNDSIQLGNNPTENASYVWFPAAGLSDPYAANPKAAPVGTTTYIVTKTQCSVTTLDTVTVTSLGLGINEEDKNSFKAYPNPANESIIIELKNISDYQIKILNNLGQVLSDNTIRSNKEFINTSAYPNGIYFIKVQNLASSAIFYDKIVISH
jgi:hypothetical protein